MTQSFRWRRKPTSLTGIVMARFLMALALVIATYNPSGFSFVHFLIDQVGTTAIWDNLLVKSLALIVLFICWWVFLHSAFRYLRGMAIILGVALFLVAYILIDLLTDNGVAVGSGALVWIVEVIVAFLLGLGVAAGHIKMWWSGTRQVDDVEMESRDA